MHLAGSSHCDGMERVCAAWMQRLDLLITLLLARGRLSSTDEADSAQCQPAHLAAAVAVLPSGLLAFIGEAIIALDSQLSADGVRKKIFAKMFAEFKLLRRKEQLEVCAHLSPCAGCTNVAHFRRIFPGAARPSSGETRVRRTSVRSGAGNLNGTPWHS